MRWRFLLLFLVALAIAYWLAGRRPVPDAGPTLPTIVIPGEPRVPQSPRPASLPASAPVAAASTPVDPSARPFGFCAEPGEKLPPVKRPSFTAALNGPAAADVREALEALKLGAIANARIALARAHRLAPEDDAIALQLGLLLQHSPHAKEAQTLLGQYLAHAKNDVSIARLHARLGTRAEIESDFAEREDAGSTLLWPEDRTGTNQAAALLSTVNAALAEAATLTGTSKRQDLTIVLYRDRSELLAVTCTPGWVGGVFDGTLRLVHDKTSALGASENDLRHETLHAQLSPLIPAEPLWFHEGLAQYFAGHGRFAWTRAYSLMVKNHTYIPFSSLSGSFFVFEGGQDAALAYAQSVAMVHLIVHSQGEQAIARAVQYFARGGAPAGVFAHLAPGGGLDEAALLQFLESKAP